MEEWRDIPGWEDLYQVSSHGRVRSKDRIVMRKAGRSSEYFKHKYKGRMMSLATDRGGYYNVTFRKTRGGAFTRKVHHLVLEAFVSERPAGAICRHLDGNPQNNRVENLSWGNHLENSRDAQEHGTSATGSRHGRSVLTEDQVIEIRNRYSRGGVSHDALSEEFGISRGVMSGIIRGELWKETGGPVSKSKKHNQKLDSDSVAAIWDRILSSDMSQPEIAREFGVNQSMISAIKNGKAYKGSDPREGAQ